MVIYISKPFSEEEKNISNIWGRIFLLLLFQAKIMHSIAFNADWPEKKVSWLVSCKKILTMHKKSC